MSLQPALLKLVGVSNKRERDPIAPRRSGTSSTRTATMPTMRHDAGPLSSVRPRLLPTPNWRSVATPICVRSITPRR